MADKRRGRSVTEYNKKDDPLAWINLRVPLVFVASWLLFGGFVVVAVWVGSDSLALAFTLLAFTAMISPFWFFASRDTRPQPQRVTSKHRRQFARKSRGGRGVAWLSVAIVIVGVVTGKWAVTLIAYTLLLGCLVISDLQR